MDTHLQGPRADPLDEREGLQPGNAAVEGFFGHLKQEFFHKRDFTCVTVDGFADDARRVHDMVPRRTHQDEYGMSIMDRRIKPGLVG